MRNSALFAVLPFLVLATTNAAGQTSRPAAASRNAITVAVLDFESSAASTADLGREVADSISATLSGQPNIELVDRSAIARLLVEHELNLSGLVDSARAIRVGKLVGARVLVVGRVFSNADAITLTAKVIGTETSRVEILKEDCESAAKVGGSIVKLSDRVSTVLRDKAEQLLPGEDRSADGVAAAREALRERNRPVVAVLIRESHVSSRAAQPPDPAVETEVKKMLRESGFTVRDVAGNSLADWSSAVRSDKAAAWPRGLDGVDVVIVGEAFSEAGARIGQLASCAARAEINVIQRSSGEIGLADRTTSRAVDLAEETAGKTALEKCGRTLGLRLLEHFARTLPAR